MLIPNDKKILIAAITGIVACISDFVVLIILGTYYPYYNHFKNTISALGASTSPVSELISVWWIILGFLFIIFGLGFKIAFRDKGRVAQLASWSVILYGIGEGIGSGVFKADHIGKIFTLSAYIHNFLGGIGIISILVLPLLMQKIIPGSEKRFFKLISWIVFGLCMLMMALFMLRFSYNENNILAIYKGLWQRLFTLFIYIYLIIIASFMLEKRKELKIKKK